MSAEKLLEDLAHRDVAISVRGERLRVEAPRGVLTEELQRSLQDRKPELMRALRRRGEKNPSAATNDFDTKVEQVAAMPLSEFANAGLILRVYSELLDCEILFVSDDVPEHDLADDDLPVYRAAELQRLAVLRPEPHTLRCIHEVKTVFDGVISHVR